MMGQVANPQYGTLQVPLWLSLVLLVAVLFGAAGKPFCRGVCLGVLLGVPNLAPLVLSRWGMQWVHWRNHAARFETLMCFMHVLFTVWLVLAPSFYV